MVKDLPANTGDTSLNPGSIPWKRKWQPTPVFLPGQFYGQRSPVGCSPQGPKGPDTTERPGLSRASLTEYTHAQCTAPARLIPSVQSLSRVRLFAAPWAAARQASLSITNSRSLLKLMSIESVMPSSHLILCRPLLLLPSIFPSVRVFSKESVLCIRWPNYLSFSFSIRHILYWILYKYITIIKQRQ